ncbi:sigma-70 family RNA polymerase sigma factor [Kitasatospora sp. NBC_01287]|uniref:sigma-70 family RNA polymerase sigma factor n=1 Tax=Kitasatospora sp. NBC_01287 TaxID=2903573 RepID=UPI0022555565|nr:sigma-70 family RNA polymerase sigma factor [Kitasatospora sp. NBC_01287]MCX4750963.1 sigma-70 family RNA polymerase sigma factor [Kitasatospora sp. NBC_01287]MCX4751786.1 sigma-70 family RNA polymerase sigma factor [Kitasatospora sp. NBC_01287]MCX4751922.1 sigma-70 family RNA polymerase sigma factor [Kitasatospora sp. NBC_01287]
MDTPPPPFEALADLTKDPGTLERAKLLTDALNAVPDLQKWLRQLRQQDVLALHEAGMSYTDIAPHLGVKPERASGIARGASRSTNPGGSGRRTKAPGPAEPDGP